MSDSANSPSSSPPSPQTSTPPPQGSNNNGSAPPPKASSTSPPGPPSSDSPPSPPVSPPQNKSPPAPPPSDTSSPPKSPETPKTPSPTPPTPSSSPSNSPAPPTNSPSKPPPSPSPPSSTPSVPSTSSPPPPEENTRSAPTPGTNPSPPSPPTTSGPVSQPGNPTAPPSETNSSPPPAAPNTPNTPPSPGQAPTPKVTPAAPQRDGSTSKALPPPASTSKGSSGNQPSGSAPSGGGSSSGQKTMVGMAVASVFIVALIAWIFVMRRRKRKRMNGYSNSSYMPPNFNVKTDGYYYGHNAAIPHSGQAGFMYNSQQHSSTGNSFGSQRGYMHSGSDSGILGGSKTVFSYEELMEITNGFSRQNVLGEGGFGCVYKGCLADGKEVAVKQLKTGSGQGEREFKAEVEIISRVHHRHLVSLVGYCISEPHRLLIYEFVPNKTLEHHLHGKGMPILDWAKRLKIAIGSAKGLAYLHEDCHPKIIHRDIKSANILLDDDFEAQVADFGLARLNDTTQSHVSTRVMGTFGYLAPEYASSGKLTDRSDVFSFGVVLLELITGRKPVDANQPLGEESLVEWARPMLLEAIEARDFSNIIDPRLENQCVESEVFRMIETAAACVRHSAPKRPRMAQVVRALDCEGEMSDLSNGVKVGQSTVYDSGQYSQDISKFRRMAFGYDENSDSALYSGEYSLRSSRRSQGASSDYTSNESETRAFNTRRH